MNLSPIKMELSDRDRLLVHRLTDSLSNLATELKRYNDGKEAVTAKEAKDRD